MKKDYVLLVIVMILVFMAGCTPDGVETKNDNDIRQPGLTQPGNASSASSGAYPGEAAAGQRENKETPVTESGGAEVIVKSGSEVASKDKAELLNQIDQELDQMIRDINNLEDISDSDLP